MYNSCHSIMFISNRYMQHLPLNKHRVTNLQYACSNDIYACVSSFQLSPEEEERKRIRRERNKLAAAKCRNRRRELTNSLQAVSLQINHHNLQSPSSNFEHYMTIICICPGNRQSRGGQSSSAVWDRQSVKGERTTRAHPFCSQTPL